MKKTIRIQKFAGEFAENKDIAKKMRVEKVMPTLSKNGVIVFDFDGVSGATQLFVHALVSDPIRKFGSTAFDNLFYKNVNNDIREIISIVYRYMQESLNSESYEE